MSRAAELIGKRFGMLIVVDRVSSTKHGASRWLCKCDCGNEIIIPYYTIKGGVKKDCGCVKRKHHNATHEGSNTKLYSQWKSMLYRCEDPKNNAYKYYGQRGISVCEEWHDFLNFKKWVEKTRPDGDFTVDRIDNNKEYSPDNCRWANKKEQANNRRSNALFEYNGEEHNLTEWSKILDFDYKRVHNRINKLHWTFEKAINTPPDRKKRNKVERTKHG